MEIAAERTVPQAAAIVARAVKRALGSDEQLRELLDDDPQDVATVIIGGADVGKLRALLPASALASLHQQRCPG
jgi:hypothetical protein